MEEKDFINIQLDVVKTTLPLCSSVQRSQSPLIFKRRGDRHPTGMTGLQEKG